MSRDNLTIRKEIEMKANLLNEIKPLRINSISQTRRKFKIQNINHYIVIHSTDKNKIVLIYLLIYTLQ